MKSQSVRARRPDGQVPLRIIGWMTMQSASQELGHSTQTLYRWIREGILRLGLIVKTGAVYNDEARHLVARAPRMLVSLHSVEVAQSGDPEKLKGRYDPEKPTELCYMMPSNAAELLDTSDERVRRLAKRGVLEARTTAGDGAKRPILLLPSSVRRFSEREARAKR